MPQTQYEYAMIAAPHDAAHVLLVKLNEAGAKGWDCLQVVELHGHLQALLKRELREGIEGDG